MTYWMIRKLQRQNMKEAAGSFHDRLNNLDNSIVFSILGALTWLPLTVRDGSVGAINSTHIQPDDSL